MGRSNMKKIAVIAVGIIIAAAVIAIGAHFYLLAAPTKLTIGYQPINHHTAAILASEKGWWEQDLAKFGIEKVEMKVFTTGPSEMHAMLAGDIDVAYVGMHHQFPLCMRV
nr:hypothetical protein BSM_01950 [uncultured archaeon]